MDAPTLMTPELTAAILDIVPATQGHIPLTLGAARYAIEHERIFWSSEGELLHPQDRTSLVIELDELIDRHGMDAAALKLTTTELQGRVMDGCLQLFGGWGYMWEYPIARAFVDARMGRIGGGSVEVPVQRATVVGQLCLGGP